MQLKKIKTTFIHFIVYRTNAMYPFAHDHNQRKSVFRRKSIVYIHTQQSKQEMYAYPVNQ